MLQSIVHGKYQLQCQKGLLMTEKALTTNFNDFNSLPAVSVARLTDLRNPAIDSAILL
jgi:hypothetical protein